ncbi:MAG: hypothetical protein WDN69_09940 [Aliidongia sp.]
MSNAKKRLKRKFAKPVLAPVRLPEILQVVEDEPEHWGPNPLAVAKIMPPPLENLRARGLISTEQYNAACEIQRVFQWVTAGLKSRLTNFDTVRGTSGDGSDPLQTAYANRYRPWADELSACRLEPQPDLEQMSRVLHSVGRDDRVALADKIAGRRRPRRDRHHPKTLQFIIDFVIDDRPIETIAREEKHDHRTVKRALFDGLTLYAEMAGWLRRAA